mgnify:CR=1 FL=1
MSAAELPTEIRAALPEACAWPAGPTPAELRSLPSSPAIYLLLDASEAPVQLATTQSLRRLLSARFAEVAVPRPKRTDLAAIVRAVRWRPLGTAFEARWWYYRLARTLHPADYRGRIAFGPAYFLNVDWERAVPELRVTERIWCQPGHFIGPWATIKAAQEALHGLWDLFDLCRYPEQVSRAPHGTRCAYAEMGRCDAPCDGSVPLAAYLERCRSAWRFAAGGVQPWIEAGAAEMQRAASQRRYEQAGLLKRQIEFARHWQRQWSPRVRVWEQFRCLLVLRVARRRAWKLLLFQSGHLTDGPVVTERRLVAGARTWLATPSKELAANLSDAVRMEQTWLVGQWLLRPRPGEGFAVPLPDSGVPDNLDDTLTEQARAFWSRRETARTEESPDARGTDESIDA